MPVSPYCVCVCACACECVWCRWQWYLILLEMINPVVKATLPVGKGSAEDCLLHLFLTYNKLCCMYCVFAWFVLSEATLKMSYTLAPSSGQKMTPLVNIMLRYLCTTFSHLPNPLNLMHFGGCLKQALNLEFLLNLKLVKAVRIVLLFAWKQPFFLHPSVAFSSIYMNTAILLSHSMAFSSIYMNTAVPDLGFLSPSVAGAETVSHGSLSKHHLLGRVHHSREREVCTLFHTAYLIYMTVYVLNIHDCMCT